MIGVLGNLHNQMKLASTSLLLPSKVKYTRLLWKTADHHGTIECMIGVLGNLHNQMKLASTSLLLPIKAKYTRLLSTMMLT